METTHPPPRVPTQLSLKLPPDVALLLHRYAYENSRRKRDIVIEGIRIVCGASA